MGCTDSKFLNTVAKKEEITIVHKSNTEEIDLNSFDISTVKKLYI